MPTGHLANSGKAPSNPPPVLPREVDIRLSWRSMAGFVMQDRGRMLLRYFLHEQCHGGPDIKAFMLDFRAVLPDPSFCAADLLTEYDDVVGQ